MDTTQTFKESYDEHKKKVIEIGKAELDDYKLGDKKIHILEMIRILQKEDLQPKEIRKKLYKDCDGYVTDRFIRKLCSLSNVELEDTENSEQFQNESSSLSRHKIDFTKPYSLERNQLVQFNYDIIDEAKANIEELLVDETEIVIDIDDKENDKKKGDVIKVNKNWAGFFESKEMTSEFFTLIKNMFYNEKETWHKSRDERYSILPHMRLPMFAYKALVLDKNFCSQYFKFIKRSSTITTKKLSQFLHDNNPDKTTAWSYSDLLHYVKEDGYLWNFIDIKCPKCKEFSLKTKMNQDGTWNFICKNTGVHQKEITFESSLLQDEIEMLANNSRGYAERFLQKKELPVPTT